MTNTLKTMKIEPMTSNRTGEAVKNQYAIKLKGFIGFQSYDSLIAIYDQEKRQLTLGYHWDYSKTTLTYLHQFIEYYCYIDLPIGRSYKDRIQKAIDNNIIVYDENMS